MSLKAIAPGTRKNRTWYFRGTVDGQRVEISSDLTADATARQVRLAKEEAERELREQQRRVPRPGDALTFADAARLYTAWRKPSKADEKRIDRLVGHIGNELLAEVTQSVLVAAANDMHPNRAPATLNREVMRPGAAILHYAAGENFCTYLRIKLFKEPRPKTRAVSVDTAVALVSAAPAGPKRLILIWLFGQGMRISDTVKVTWEQIVLQRQTVTLHISKGDLYVEKPLAPDVFEELTAVPEGQRKGPVFPWRTKSGVYKWLRPLAEKVGVKFTPHMARHSLGTWLNAEGAGLRTIMGALDHADPKSSVRYQTADVEIIRAATARLPRLTGGETGEVAETRQKA